MQRFTLSKFYRPENVVEYAVSRVRECGGVLDKIRYPKPGEEDGPIWVTYVVDSLPGAFRISKDSMGPYRVHDIPLIPLFYDEDVAGFMMDTLRAYPAKDTLKTVNRARFEAICAWLHREPDVVMEQVQK